MRLSNNIRCKAGITLPRIPLVVILGMLIGCSTANLSRMNEIRCAFQAGGYSICGATSKMEDSVVGELLVKLKKNDFLLS